MYHIILNLIWVYIICWYNLSRAQKWKCMIAMNWRTINIVDARLWDSGVVPDMLRAPGNNNKKYRHFSYTKLGVLSNTLWVLGYNNQFPITPYAPYEVRGDVAYASSIRLQQSIPHRASRAFRIQRSYQRCFAHNNQIP